MWRALLDRVESPPARARIAHALHQGGGTTGLDDARIAAENYILAANHWQRPWDADEDLRAAARLARILKDNRLVQQAIGKLLDAAESALTQESIDAPGPILRPLDYALHEPDCPERIDALLEQAATKLAQSDDRDRALTMIFERCSDDECRKTIWRRRVENYLSAAETDTGIIQMMLRRDALNIAEASGIKELRARAAAALQATRARDLELISVKSSSVVYQETYEQFRDTMSAGTTWQEALLSFATCGPLSGDHEKNRAQVENMRNLAPLQALLPDQLLGPDGLPIYEAISLEDRFDGDLTRWESNVISSVLQPLTAALHSIPGRFGIPATLELATFLNGWPAMSRQVLPIATGALQRFWCGDFEGATYLATPWIEAVIRQLIIDAEHGMFRLQTIHKPGQYPGLGAMLDLLPGRFNVGPNALRYLKATLTHPRGFNLRNQLSHGVIHYNGSPAAALVIHTLLMVTLIQPVDAEREPEPEDEHPIKPESEDPTG